MYTLSISVLSDLFKDDFLDLTLETKAVKAEMRLHQTKKLLPSQGNHQQNEKATYPMGDNNCKKNKKVYLIRG